MDKMKVSVFNAQNSFGIVLDTRETSELDNGCRSLGLLRVCHGNYGACKNQHQSGKECRPLECHGLSSLMKFSPVQRTWTSTRETSSVGGPLRQAATPSRIPCFISCSGKVD